MSEMEHRKGKLIPQLDKNETIEDGCLRILKREEKETDIEMYNNIKELFTDELYQEYYLGETEIYEIDCEHFDDQQEISEAKRLENGNIEVDLQWYNGGASINEMIYQALGKI